MHLLQSIARTPMMRHDSPVASEGKVRRIRGGESESDLSSMGGPCEQELILKS